MTTPAAMCFGAIVASVGLLFVLWHTYHYDKWRCLLYTPKGWFRAMMTQILLVSVGSFVGYTWIEAHILYDEYYILLGDETVPAPWQLWSSSHQTLWKSSLYLLCTGWCALQAIHLEEFLYWGYLIHGIRSSRGPQWSWLSSPFFKLWIIAFLCGWAILFGAISIETENLDMMKTYLFLVGSIMSCLMATASAYLCFIFPSFITSVRRQGAAEEVLDRLHFFAEMNESRTVFRMIYSTALLILSADAMTDTKRINSSRLWSDILFTSAHLAIFASTCLSVVILLPRNMTSESVPSPSNCALQPMVPYKQPQLLTETSALVSPQRQFYELGDRLNVDPEILAVGLINDQGFEMASPSRSHKSLHPLPVGMGPGFDGVVGASKRARFSDMPGMPSLPGVLARLRPPPSWEWERSADGEGSVRKGRGSHVFVTTSQTVERD